MRATIRRTVAVLALSVAAAIAPIAAAAPAHASTNSGPVWPPTVIVVQWNVNASTHIKKLNQTVNVPDGKFVGIIDLATGNLLGALSLPPTQIQMKALGLLPLVTATFQMQQVGVILGHIDSASGVVTTTASFNIRITSLTAAGLPANLVGNDCKSSTPITVTMGGPVDLAHGSTFTGTYTIPPLEDCHALTPALNAVIPGPGNTFTASFAPPAS